MSDIYGYYINNDERGDFQADIRDTKGVTVYEVKAGDSLGEDETSIFDDGFMKDRNDLAGLQEYLVGLKVIPAHATVLFMQEFERRVAFSEQHPDAPLNGEVEKNHFNEQTETGFIIRPEDSDTDEYKAEEWRNGDIVDFHYGTYASASAWVQSELLAHNEAVGAITVYVLPAQEDITAFEFGTSPNNILVREFGNAAELTAYKDGLDAITDALDVIDELSVAGCRVSYHINDDADLTEVAFSTPEEAEAFRQGLDDAEGFTAPRVIAPEDDGYARLSASASVGIKKEGPAEAPSP